MAADALSSKLRDQNSTIKALKAERDPRQGHLAHAQRELAGLRASFDETAGEHNTDRQKLEMMEADVASVCEVLEAAAANEPSFLTVRVFLPPLPTALLLPCIPHIGSIGRGRSFSGGKSLGGGGQKGRGRSINEASRGEAAARRSNIGEGGAKRDAWET